MKFVGELQKHLQLWSFDGDSNNLLTSLENNTSNFPGIHLQPILNRIWLELREKETLTNEKIKKHEELASAKLQEIATPRFLQGINLLYSQINELSKLTEPDPQVIDELTIQLRYKTNDFIINNEAGKPLIKESVEKFRTEFMTLLHSHDDILTEQNKFWQPFLINLAIAFLTLGLAIGIKLVSSKLSTGRASFFCADTAALNHVNLIERTAREVLAPAG